MPQAYPFGVDQTLSPVQNVGMSVKDLGWQHMGSKMSEVSPHPDPSASSSLPPHPSKCARNPKLNATRTYAHIPEYLRLPRLAQAL